MASLKQVTENKRYCCPFYGFHMVPGELWDTEGNECALITDSYSPCQMEMDRDIPDLHVCPIVNEQNKKNLEKISDYFRVFPKEFKSKGKASEGIPFKDWKDYLEFNSWQVYMPFFFSDS